MFKTPQCVDADNVCRDEVMKLHEWRLGPPSAGFEQNRNLRFGEATGKMDDPTFPLVSNLDSARHAGRKAKGDPTILYENAEKLRVGHHGLRVASACNGRSLD